MGDKNPGDQGSPWAHEPRSEGSHDRRGAPKAVLEVCPRKTPKAKEAIEAPAVRPTSGNHRRPTAGAHPGGPLRWNERVGRPTRCRAWRGRRIAGGQSALDLPPHLGLPFPQIGGASPEPPGLTAPCLRPYAHRLPCCCRLPSPASRCRCKFRHRWPADYQHERVLDHVPFSGIVIRSATSTVPNSRRSPSSESRSSGSLPGLPAFHQPDCIS
jgi:hypothetical protein